MSRKRRVVLGVAALALGGLVVWSALDLRSARNDLNAARAELQAAASELGTATDAEGATKLREATRNAVERTDRAHKNLKRDPLLKIISILPPVGTQRDGLIRAAAIARDAARVGDRLTETVEGLHDRLQIQNAAVDLDALTTLADVAGQAGDDLDKLPKAHRGGQWGPLGNATRSLDEVIVDTTERLTHGAATMRVAHDLLGGDGQRRILIALLNNAEMRDQGMVLSYAVAETNNGQLRTTRSGSVSALELRTPVTDVTLPAGTAHIFGALAPLQYWQSVNATADTAIAGELIRSLYKAKTGETIDGVLALDVPAIASLLGVTGPVTIPGIAGEVGPENAARVLLNDLYVQADESAEGRDGRQAKLAEVATALINRIQTSSFNATALIRALGTAATGGHTWVSAANPDQQKALEAAGIGGGPANVDPERTFHLAVQNGTATKLDWFVDPAVDVDVSVTQDGTAVVTTKVTIPNGAPLPTPSSEQFGPDNIVNNVPGLYRARVYLWSPKGSDVLGGVDESGLNLGYGIVDVLPGDRQTVTFSTVVPNAVQDGTLRLRFVPQARVRPMELSVTVNALGWKLKSRGTQTAQWDRTLDMSWKLKQVR